MCSVRAGSGAHLPSTQTLNLHDEGLVYQHDEGLVYLHDEGVVYLHDEGLVYLQDRELICCQKAQREKVVHTELSEPPVLLLVVEHVHEC